MAIDLSSIGHSHSSGGDPGESLSYVALYFPILGIIVKEYLYRVTKHVAEEESSGVLMANAMHHRSDAYSSLVTVMAICGSLLAPNLPLDPLGGIAVVHVVLLQLLTSSI